MNISELDDIRQLLQDLVETQSSTTSNPQLTSAYLRDLEMRLRKVRGQAFPTGYFSDFAWDILMELDQAARRGDRYAVTDAGLGAGISLATTVRYIAKLEKDGYVVRENDPRDRRRCYVSLTQKGQAAMDHVFDRVVANTPAH